MHTLYRTHAHAPPHTHTCRLENGVDSFLALLAESVGEVVRTVGPPESFGAACSPWRRRGGHVPNRSR
jgi:hypothetical protein